MWRPSSTPAFDVVTLGDEPLLEFLTLANILYRAGEQLIDDDQYDMVFLADYATGCRTSLFAYRGAGTTDGSENHRAAFSHAVHGKSV